MSLAPAISETFRVSRTASRPDQAASPETWNRLAGDVPFRQWEWLDSWWRHYRNASAEPFVLTARGDDGELAGIAPWYLQRSSLRGRVVRALGSGEVCSDYVSLLAEDANRQAVARSFAEWLATDGAGSWDLIHLDGIPPDDVATDTLVDELAQRGHEIHVRQTISSWRIALPATWPEYVSQLSRTRRERVKQLSRRVFDAGRAVSRFATTDAELEQGWRILVDLHQRRRESLGQPGCFSSPRFAAFHADAARRMFQLGRLRLHWIELDGRPVAVEYALTGGDTVYYYQSGLEPSVIEERPGWLNLIGSIRAAIDEGYTNFDFLRGDEAYKASWRGQQVPLREIRIVGRHRSARWRHRAWLQASSAKRHLRAGLDRLRAKLPGAKPNDSKSDNP